MADKQTVKVGDKVKSLVTQLDVREGATYEVKNIDFDGDIWVTDDVGDRFYLTTDEFELLPVAGATGKPAFKVGDRVRLIKDGLSTTGAVGKLATIKSWSGGKVVDNGQYLLNIDGPVDYETLAVQPQYTRASPECFELLAPSLTIETGKFYRTRDGRKVGPMRRQAFGWVASKRIIATDQCDWYEGGNFSLYRDREHDLISEWVDEPASNDNRPATKPAIVALIEKGQPKPSELPRVHASEYAAINTAVHQDLPHAHAQKH
ncbi:hypothetical protein [Brucella haematophila]|uniref:Uncharacterized protein n=1 Tax=Brucella haematophila TaxID=419474 RepID=A0ABX1DT67_9HYPH|nr:hypothetical protein [Brucella haematophila]NKC04457.1 hypothetical protein [Brucella haematophila]TMU84706.1 hypothetical protein FGI60_25925 [Brucella haematophila]